MTIIACFALMGSCAQQVSNNGHATKQKAIEAGMDALDMPCAIGDGSERYCEMRAVTKGQK